MNKKASTSSRIRLYAYRHPGVTAMYIEMICSCTASISVDMDKGKEDAAWLLAARFSSAHVACGFISPLLEEAPITTKRFDIKTTPDQDA